MTNAQTWLDDKHPKENRKKITELLNLRGQTLEGTLDLSDFVNLEELDCGNNKLASLKLNNCLKLIKIWCYGNKLTRLEIDKKLTELVHLDCRDNNLSDLELPDSAEN